MSTVLEAPAEATPVQAAPEKPSLWEGQELEVICGTGEYGTGKTIFGISICPGAQTVVYDQEGSSTPYKELGFHHVDMASQLRAWLVEKGMRREATAEDRWTWFRDDSLSRANSGLYLVMMVDPFSEIEAGLARYVESHPEEFGYTANQFKKSAGLFWGAVKDALKEHLDKLRSRLDTIYLVTHMRNEFRGNAPTGKREPKGKATLFELASLYLEFQRPIDQDGKQKAIPEADVLKSRLAIAKMSEAGGIEWAPLLPPHLPEATPAAIRNYIKNPPNFKRLKAGERVKTEDMSEEEKLRLELAISENNRATEESQLSRIEKMQIAAARQASVQLAKPVAPDQAAAHAQAQQEKSQAAAALITTEQLHEMKRLVGDLKLSGPAFIAMLNECDCATPQQLLEGQATSLLVHLNQTQSAMLQEQAADKLQAASPAADPACEPKIESSPDPQATAVAVEPKANGKALLTKEQLLEIKNLAGEANWTHDKQAAFLKLRGVGSFRSLTQADGDGIINRLRQTIEGFKQSENPSKN